MFVLPRLDCFDEMCLLIQLQINVKGCVLTRGCDPGKWYVQKFRFCGDLDCPDWILAGISALSGVSSIKVKTMGAAVISGLLGDNFDIEKVRKQWPAKAAGDASDGKDGEIDKELSLCCSTLEFIFHSAAKNAVDLKVLGEELQQLGLPKEHATALSKLHSSHGDDLKSFCNQNSLRVNPFHGIEWKVVMSPGEGCEWDSRAVVNFLTEDQRSSEKVRNIVSLDQLQLRALLTVDRDSFLCHGKILGGSVFKGVFTKIAKLTRNLDSRERHREERSGSISEQIPHLQRAIRHPQNESGSCGTVGSPPSLLTKEISA
ncbi:unnamed protein product [Notodromas monacha]|uniref:COMM domain-containing protein n=1 Tax=Notodromas monacha TaxID=399045 RepID=A0A7R9BW73_9CRUS|nr:unnamed protein product [Notodromas monacha]CAG0922515.1 unnamed protein product [Notodromas monacha]